MEINLLTYLLTITNSLSYKYLNILYVDKKRPNISLLSYITYDFIASCQNFLFTIHILE